MISSATVQSATVLMNRRMNAERDVMTFVPVCSRVTGMHCIIPKEGLRRKRRPWAIMEETADLGGYHRLGERESQRAVRHFPRLMGVKGGLPATGLRSWPGHLYEDRPWPTYVIAREVRQPKIALW